MKNHSKQNQHNRRARRQTSNLDPLARARGAAKARIIAQGKTYDQVAAEIGHPKWLISRVLNGISKAKYGKAHDCAVALGIKSADDHAA